MTYTVEKVVFHAPSRFRSHSHYMAQCALIPIYRMWMCVCVSVINTSFTLNRTLGRVRLAREWLNKAQIINFYIFFNEIAIIYWRAFNEKCCICYSLPWHCLKHDSINFQTVFVVVVWVLLIPGCCGLCVCIRMTWFCHPFWYIVFFFIIKAID